MEAKFCPQCGSARLGNFCGRCGFSFLALQKTVSPSAEQQTLPGESGAAGRKLPKGLVRSESFDPHKHCDNCGLELSKGSICMECGE